jgi:hypothetical protein
MLGLTSGELTLVLILVGAVTSARFWPALGAAIAVRLAPAAERAALGQSQPPGPPRPRDEESNR